MGWADGVASFCKSVSEVHYICCEIALTGAITQVEERFALSKPFCSGGGGRKERSFSGFEVRSDIEQDALSSRLGPLRMVRSIKKSSENQRRPQKEKRDVLAKSVISRWEHKNR